ncbi:hypothetical protein [Viridibacillus arvi]|uniref:hypothetical protein n=1 Tax=Viridibacillus arvi TaxID=263475 RepID=UPI003D2B8730
MRKIDRIFKVMASILFVAPILTAMIISATINLEYIAAFYTKGLKTNTGSIIVIVSLMLLLIIAQYSSGYIFNNSSENSGNNVNNKGYIFFMKVVILCYAIYEFAAFHMLSILIFGLNIKIFNYSTLMSTKLLNVVLIDYTCYPYFY